MAEVHTQQQPDVMKVFEAIARIMSQREGRRVQLVEVRRPDEKQKRAG